MIAVSILAQAGQGKPHGTTAVELKKAEKAYTALKTYATKHPKDAKAKKDYVSATVIYANLSMYSDTLSSKVKYAQAYRLYREALKVDPKNKEAKESCDMLVSIYNSLHKPLPKDGS